MPKTPVVFACQDPAAMSVRDPARDRILRGLGEAASGVRALALISQRWCTLRPSVAPLETSAGPPSAEIVAEVVGALRRRGYDPVGGPPRAVDPATGSLLAALTGARPVPAVAISIQPLMGLAHHHRLGRALRALPDLGMLVFACGSTCRATDQHASQEDQAFTQWLDATMASGDITALLEFRRRAPNVWRCMPTDEPLLPLLVALAAKRAGDLWETRYRNPASGSNSRDVYASRSAAS